MTNQWTFIGECVKTDTKPAGRANITTAILRRVDGDAESAREVFAAAEIWNSRGPAVGDVVVAGGTVSTREYNGKWYTSLRCDRWYKIAIADRSEPRQAPRQAPEPQRQDEAAQSHTEDKGNAFQPQGDAQGAIPF